MNEPLLSSRIYFFLFSLAGLVCIAGLFVPLMDNDAAHHANIALHMHLTGDYVNLVDNGTDYLDKPHLHFWLAALSYKFFGISGFAYKLPSFLFGIAGVYSVFRLGRALYDSETGKLAALMMATAFAFLLSLSDVRMDAILTAAIAFSTWQLVELVLHRKLLGVLGAAAGLAIGFSCKGMIGVVVPAISAISFLLFQRKLKLVFTWQWLLLVLLFFVFISPVLYCYYQQFNLHPEKIVRGRDHINGIKFILFDQGRERWGGEMSADSRADYLFFLYTFTWAFAPWSVLTWLAFALRVTSRRWRREEWLSPATFFIVLLLISFAGSKLPHYVNIIFPAASVLTAWLILKKIPGARYRKWIEAYGIIATTGLVLAALVINGWMFPATNPLVLVVAAFLLGLICYFLFAKQFTLVQKQIIGPALGSIFLFFLLNASFYPKLLGYQGGQELARLIKGKVDPADVFFWRNNYSSSFNFYSASLRRQFEDSVLDRGRPSWLMFDRKNEQEILAAGYKLGTRYEARDFEITKLDVNFLNPRKRESRCSRMVLAEISR